MSQSPNRGPRVAALVASAVLAVFGLTLLAGGGALLYGDARKDDSGYLNTSRERFATNTRALATESLDVDLAGLEELAGDGVLGKVRLDVAPAGDKPVFVGVARSDDVDRYLRGSAHTTVADVDSSPFRADYRDHAGSKRLAPPAGETFWTDSVEGAGGQKLDWKVADGDWSVVVMNADGSPRVDASVKAGASVPFLNEAGWIVGGLGLLTLVLASGLLYAGVRRPAQRPEEPNPLAPRPVVSS
jgi:hypothetical protein